MSFRNKHLIVVNYFHKVTHEAKNPSVEKLLINLIYIIIVYLKHIIRHSH